AHPRMPAFPVRRARHVIPLMLLAALLGGDSDRRFDPPVLVDRIFEASTNSSEAFAYVTRDDRLRPGTAGSPVVLIAAHCVRRLPDGVIVKELPLADMSGMKDSTPRIVGISVQVLWIQQDSVEG